MENSNRAIFFNAFVMYIRLAIVTICGLFTTRFALNALGITDFGLFSVVGGVTSFIALFNTIMVTTSNRFIATAIGKKDDSLVNKTFNVNLVIHILIAIVTLIIAYPLGDWYILHHVNFEGDIQLAIKVYNISIMGSIISFIGVPYNGLMLAKERFFAFSIIEIVFSIVKMCGAFMLLYYFANKLFVYAVLLSSLTALPTIIYILYCNVCIKQHTKFCFVTDKKLYKDVLKFSIWIGYGAIATIGKNQGATLIINKFFNMAMNTALGVSQSVSCMIQVVAYNVGKSIAPQITKSYAAGDINRSVNLAIACSKYSYLLLIITASPFLVEPAFIYDFWLGEVPSYSIIFTKLLIIDALIISLNAGIPELVFASGNIKWYQIIMNSMLLLSVVVAFGVLSMGFPAYFLQIIYVCFSIIILIARQVVLNKVVKMNNWRIIKESYIPCFLVSLLYCPYLYLNFEIHPLINMIFSTFYLFVLTLILGLSKTERQYIKAFINKNVRHYIHK